MKEILETAVASSFLYILIIICLRILGKKGLTEISLGDLVLIILIGEAFSSIIPQQNSFVNAITSVITLTLMNFIIERLVFKSKFLKKYLEGTPVILIDKGKIKTRNLKKEKMTKDDLNEALRSNGIKDIKNVDKATLETDGEISIIKK